MSGNNKRITIKIIADLVGVSHKTVSRVINNEKYVKEETRKKILAVIKKYNFQPNFFAKGLRTKESKTIGLILGDINNPFYSLLTEGVIMECEKEGYNVIVVNTSYATDIGNRYIKVLLGKGIDGLIITTINFTENILNSNIINIPYILVSLNSDIQYINYVTADDYNGGLLAAEYLIKLGHRKIYFLTVAEVVSAGNRVQAFKDVIKKYEISNNDSSISKPLINEHGSYSEVKKIIKNGNKYTAFIAGNDSLAIGAMRAIYEAGLKIPEDISIIGYDNISVASILKTPLTTVEQPKFELGSIGAKRLLAMLKDPIAAGKKPMRRILPTKLIIRKSCKKINN